MNENRLSDAERYIMKQFWICGAMRSDEVAARVADKQWTTTTLLTFLSRLVAKGMLSVEKHGRANLYIPLIGEREYKKAEGRAFLDEQYDGSARDFLAAMVDSRGISDADLEQLREWIAAQKGIDDA